MTPFSFQFLAKRSAPASINTLIVSTTPTPQASRSGVLPSGMLPATESCLDQSLVSLTSASLQLCHWKLGWDPVLSIGWEPQQIHGWEPLPLSTLPNRTEPLRHHSRGPESAAPYLNRCSWTSNFESPTRSLWSSGLSAPTNDELCTIFHMASCSAPH